MSSSVTLWISAPSPSRGGNWWVSATGECVWEQEPEGKAVTRQKNVVWVPKAAEIGGDLALISTQKLHCLCLLSPVSALNTPSSDLQMCLYSLGVCCTLGRAWDSFPPALRCKLPESSLYSKYCTVGVPRDMVTRERLICSSLIHPSLQHFSFSIKKSLVAMNKHFCDPDCKARLQGF